jgi:hypothetical protein
MGSSQRSRCFAAPRILTRSWNPLTLGKMHSVPWHFRQSYRSCEAQIDRTSLPILELLNRNMRRPFLNNSGTADAQNRPSFVARTYRKRVGDRPTLNSRHHTFASDVLKHLLAGMSRHTSHNGMDALMYVSCGGAINVPGVCNVSDRQDIDTSPTGRLLYPVLAVVMGTQLLTPSCMLSSSNDRSLEIPRQELHPYGAPRVGEMRGN